MPNNFYDEFNQYAREQDKWIYHDSWSLPEHCHYAYILEESAKYEAGNIVECIRMDSSDNPYKLKHQISVYLYKHIQSQHIWSGYIGSLNEYQEMMSAVNKFIEENKDNSGAK